MINVFDEAKKSLRHLKTNTVKGLETKKELEKALEQAQKTQDIIEKVCKAIAKGELSKFEILSILSATIGIGNENDKLNLEDFLKGEEND